MLRPQKFPTDDSSSPYCFNKILFTRDEFSTERFINVAKHRGTLDDISVDLRTYLKTIQEDLVELINLEYADFVNLSSSLVGLSDVIERIGENGNEAFDTFKDSTFQLKEAANQLAVKKEQLMKCKQEQILVRNKIHFIESSFRLIKLLDESPSELSVAQIERFSISLSDICNWFEACIEDAEGDPNKIRDYDRVKNLVFMRFTKLATASLKNYFRDGNSKNVDSLMACLVVVGEENYPMEVISKDIVQPQLERLFAGKEKLNEKMGLCLDKVLALREAFLENYTETGNYCFTFIDTSLLKGLKECIKNKVASTILSSDTGIFQECFNKLLTFSKSYPRLAKNTPLLKPCLQSFNMAIYFNLITQDYTKRMNSEMGKAKNKQIEAVSIGIPVLDYDNDYPNYFCLDATKALMEAFASFNNDDVILEPLLFKSWCFLVNLIKEYVQWLDKMLEIELPEDGLFLVALCSDVVRIEDAMVSIIYGGYKERIEGLGLDWTPFVFAFSILFEVLVEKSEVIKGKIIELYKDSLIKQIKLVEEIPKNYRWTKKPMPTAHSGYLNEVELLLKKYEGLYNQFGLDGSDAEEMIKGLKEFCHKSFEELAGKLSDSIHQTFSSLQRFKNRDGTPETDFAATDESKMLKQLQFDKEWIQVFCGVQSEA